MMGSKEKLKVMLSLMKELDNGNVPSASDYGLEQSEFGTLKFY